MTADSRIDAERAPDLFVQLMLYAPRLGRHFSSYALRPIAHSWFEFVASNTAELTPPHRDKLDPRKAAALFHRFGLTTVDGKEASWRRIAKHLGLSNTDRVMRLAAEGLAFLWSRYRGRKVWNREQWEELVEKAADWISFGVETGQAVKYKTPEQRELGEDYVSGWDPDYALELWSDLDRVIRVRVSYTEGGRPEHLDVAGSIKYSAIRGPFGVAKAPQKTP